MTNSSFACVYKITIGQRFYIGSTNKFSARKSTHLSSLNRNKHGNVKIQRAYNKYDRKALFSVMIFCRAEDRSMYEQIFINELNPSLNIEMVVGKPMDGRSHTKEARARMSAAALGRIPSDEARARMSAAGRGRKRSPEAIEKTASFHRGRKMPPEAVEKMAATKRGKKLTEEHKAKISAGERGIKKSPEHVEKVAAAHRGMKRSPDAIANMIAAQRARREKEKRFV